MWLHAEAAEFEDEWRALAAKGFTALEALLPDRAIAPWLDVARETVAKG